MRTLFTITLVALLAVMLAACGAGAELTAAVSCHSPPNGALDLWGLQQLHLRLPRTHLQNTCKRRNRPEFRPPEDVSRYGLERYISVGEVAAEIVVVE